MVGLRGCIILFVELFQNAISSVDFVARWMVIGIRINDEAVGGSSCFFKSVVVNFDCHL